MPNNEQAEVRILGWNISLAIWARVLPFVLYMLFLALEGLLADLVPAIDVRWVYPVKIAPELALGWADCPCSGSRGVRVVDQHGCRLDESG